MSVQSSWDDKPLSELLSADFDGVWGEEAQGLDGVPVLRSTDMRGGFLTFDDVAIRKIQSTVLAKKCLRNGDILVNKSSGSAHLVGASVLFVAPDEREFTCSNFLRCLRPDTAKIVPEFLHYALKSPQFRSQVFGAQRTTSGLRNLKLEEYKSSLISYPSIPDQYRIIARIRECLERADEIEDLSVRARLEAQHLPMAIRYDLWEECARKYKLVTLQALTASTKNGLYKPSVHHGTGHVLLRMFNINGATLDLSRIERIQVTEEEGRNFSVKNGDVLISRVNSKELVGKSALVQGLSESAVHEAMLIRLRVVQEAAEGHFLVSLMNSPQFLHELRRKARHAIGQSSINQQDLLESKLPLPTLAEQLEQLERFQQFAMLSRALALDWRPRKCSAQHERRSATQSILEGALTVEQNLFQEQTRRLIDSLRSTGLRGSHLRDLLTAVVLLRWADYQEAEEEAMAEFEDRQWHSVLPSRLRWGVWFRLPPTELGQLLFRELPAYLTGLRSRSETALAAYLSALSEPLQHLATTNIGVVCDVVHWVGDQPLETNNDRHLFLEFFDSLLAETVEKREGEFVTPQSIAKLAVAIADPGPGDRVYDPCFGFGGFLTTAWEVAERNAKGLHGRRTGEPLSLFGMEINSSAYLVGLTRVILSGASHPRLERGNSLEREPAAGQNGQGFDIVLANPPMGARLADEALRFQHFPIRTRDVTSLFIQHILQQLKPQGRAVISVPEGFLFRGGAEQELRRYLVERGHLQTVVALPEGAFAPHTMVRGSLLVLRKEAGGDRVRMIDARSSFQRAETGRALELPLQQIDRLAAIVNDPSELFNRPVLSSGVIEQVEVWTVSAAELADVDWDLTPRRREKGGLDQLLSALQGLLRESGRIVRLDECAEIIAGRSIASKDLVNQPQGERPAAYIRIRDIRKGVASEGSNWVGAAALSTIEPKWRLLPGDLLLSKSGTIGKAGVVRNGAVGAIAANGLYVVRVDKEQLDPHFLLAYFASSACRNWLGSQSRGIVIQHLNRPILDQLPVPIVPISLQHRAAMQFREHGTDVINFLTEALGDLDRDPIAFWLAEASSRLPNTIDAISDPLSLSPLEGLWDSVRPIRNQVAHAKISSSLAPWLLSFAESLRAYQGLSNIPKGPALLSLITESLRGLQRSRELIQGYLPAEAQARDLNDLLLKWLDRAVEGLLTNVNLVFTPGSRTLQIGRPVEVSISVENLSSLPLRNLEVVTAPDWGRQTFPFVGEGKSFALSLRGEAPKLLGIFSLTTEWTAQTLDGRGVRGNRQISFDVVETERVETQAENLGSSPYVTGTPVYPSRDDVFFGRRPLLEQISRQITASGNVVLLEGNRRSGKSSVLHHLEGTTAIPRWLAVYCSLQGMEGSDTAVGVPTVEIFRKIADSIATSLTKLNIDTPLPNGKVLVAGQKALGVGRACKEGISESSPFTDCREYIQVALDLLATRDLGLVLMLDEFDKLQEGIESGITSPQVPENIRYLVQTCPRFSAILTGSRRLKRLRHEYWSALYGLGTRFGVSALEADDARRLVAEPVRGKLTFSPEAIDRVISITACQPYLLQCLCNHIFDFAAHTKTRSITLDAIEHAAASYIKDNEHFASLWGYAETDRRRLILILCSKRADDDLLMFGALQELLLQHGIELAEEELEEDLAFLRELELIDLVGKIGDGHYKLSIPLMGRWIEQQQDFDIVLRKAQGESEERHV